MTAPPPTDFDASPEARAGAAEFFDFFIIHSSREADLARQFYEALRDDFSVFLDRASIRAGSEWDQRLNDALLRTRAFLVLISARFDEAHFAREEYQIAINLHRTSPEPRTVVPITTEVRAMLPYGLGLFQGLDFDRDGGFPGVVSRLKEEFQSRKARTGPSPSPPQPPPPPTSPRHPLHDFSRRGKVPPELVTEDLVAAFASLHDPLLGPTMGSIFVNKANAFRREADPGDPTVTVVETYTLPPAGSVAPIVFWRAVLSEARLHSPRMLAAVLTTANTNAFGEAAWKDHQTLIGHLRKMPP